MDKKRILETFYQWNGWWTNQEFHLPKYKRSLFYNLQKELKNNKVTALVGPRQTGKSTLVLQLIESLIKDGVDPKSILYVPLDDIVTILGKDTAALYDLIEVFSLDVQKSTVNADEKIIIFDEVHYFKGWSSQLKSLHDKKLPIKFFVLGSSGIDILKGSSESLAGRISIHYVLPMSFAEIVLFELGKKHNVVNVRKIQQEIYNSFFESINGNKFDILYEVLVKAEKELIPLRENIKLLMDNYLIYGGFPEVVFNNLHNDEAHRRLRQYIDLIFYKDFVSFFSVRDTRSLERLFYLISKETSNMLSENKIAKDLGMAINTLRNYLEFLENAFLINSAKSYADSPAKQLRRSEKLFVADLGLAGSLVAYTENDSGKKIETVIFNHLKSLQTAEFRKENILYWRKSEQFEVDILLSGAYVLPIEVKSSYTDKLKGLRKFMEEKKCKGLVISDKLDFKENIISIPQYLFLMMSA